MKNTQPLTSAERTARYRAKHPERVKAWRTANKEKLAQKNHERYLKNKDKWNLKTRTNKAKLYKTSLNFRLCISLRSRIAGALKKNKKPGSVTKDLGCTIEQLKVHLESMFKPGMSWSNRNEWHVDHIKPLSSFDLTNREQFLKACHYTNLQPLWAIENLRKGNK